MVICHGIGPLVSHQKKAEAQTTEECDPVLDGLKSSRPL